jgi:hypothetical protein
MLATYTSFINCKIIYYQGLFLFSYLTDFSYFPLKKIQKVARHGQNRSKIEALVFCIQNTKTFTGVCACCKAVCN